MSSRSGYILNYQSLSELQDDHDSYIAHGGLMVPCPDATLPEANAQVLVRVNPPIGDQTFDLSGRVVHHVPGQGFMVAFDDASSEVRANLTRFLASDAFFAAKGLETNPAPKLVGAFEPEAVKVDLPKRKPKYLKLQFADPEAEKLAASERAEAAEAAEAEEATGDFEESTPVDEGGPAAAQQTASAGGEKPEGVEFKRPEHGDMYGVFVIKFATLLDFQDVGPTFLETHLITIPWKFEEEALTTASAARRNVSRKPGDPARLRFQLPGKNVFDVWTVVAHNSGTELTFMAQETDPKFNELCAFPMTFQGRKRLGAETDEQRGALEVYMFAEERNVEEEDVEKIPIRRRLARMSMEEKINLALSGGREARQALAQDSNKAIPMYLMRNARISIDEIAFMARLASMNPDVLKKIAENPQYVQSPQVVRNLVFNPKTPITIAIRLLDRLPRSELIMLSKRTSGNRRLIMKAKDKLGKAKR